MVALRTRIVFFEDTGVRAFECIISRVADSCIATVICDGRFVMAIDGYHYMPCMAEGYEGGIEGSLSDGLSINYTSLQRRGFPI